MRVVDVQESIEAAIALLMLTDPDHADTARHVAGWLAGGDNVDDPGELTLACQRRRNPAGGGVGRRSFPAGESPELSRSGGVVASVV